MKCKKLLAVAVWLSIGLTSLQAQDIHFSQFYMSPLNLNPAMTGVMNCNHRFIANYRNQWASVLKGNAYKTYAASYDMAIPVGRYDFFGGGISLWGDKAGTSNFATTQGKLSLSYSKRMGGYRQKSHYLVAGIDAGLTQRSIDFLNLRYGTQHNGNGQFDPNLPSYEEGFVNNYMFGDISAGLLWFSMLGKDKSFWLGGAMHHLNRANQSFTEDRTFEGLYTKLTLHGGADIMFTPKYGIVPNIVFLRQGPSFELSPGASFKLNLSKSKREYQAFQLGAWLRLANHYEKSIASDALILTTRFDYNNIGLGFSYDVNISSLQPASNSNGAFELNLQYKICNGFKRSDYCPAF